MAELIERYFDFKKNKFFQFQKLRLMLSLLLDGNGT